MNITRVSRGAVCCVSILIAFVVPAQSSAQDLLAARTESLDGLFDAVEAIANAAGQDFSREMVLGMGAEVLGSNPGSFLAMDRPAALLMPVEGMMMRQDGVVVALPVTDAATAIDTLASQFPNHAVEGELHTFSGDQRPPFYLTATDGYIKIGGSADLVTRLDPLAYGPTGSTLSVEIFVEPIAPMITANLDMAKAQLRSSLDSEVASSEGMPLDAATMGPALDAYFNGFRWLIANTSSIRVRLDMDDGYVRFAEDLIPKTGGDLAGFIAVQTGGLPEIAKLADEGAAWYMAGRVTLTDEHRQGFKVFVDDSMDIMNSMIAAQGGAETDTDSEPARQEATAMWKEFMALLGPYAGRWIDCLRGDMVASFDFPDGRPFELVKAFGLVGSDECATLISEMRDEFVNAIGSSDEMSGSFTVSSGPEIGGSESLVMTFDTMKMLDEMGQPSDERVAAMMNAMYGEKMSSAMVAVGDVVLVASGTHAIDRLGELLAMQTAPGKAPSFSPLEVRPGLMFGMNLGAMLTWIKNAVPEGDAVFDGAADLLTGDVGRVPMAITFGKEMATFDIAVSLETIEAIAAVAEEHRARAAEIEEPE